MRRIELNWGEVAAGVVSKTCEAAVAVIVAWDCASVNVKISRKIMNSSFSIRYMSNYSVLDLESCVCCRVA
jgi:hypothetical protein